MDDGDALGDGKSDPGAGGAVGVGGGTIVAVEDALAVSDGDYRSKTVNREDDLGVGPRRPNGDGGAKDRVLSGVVDVLRKQHDHQLAVAVEHQAVIRDFDSHFHACQPVTEACYDFLNQ